MDAANVTDNQGARVRMSSLAGSAVLLAEGLDPVMQMTCRDRNRIALQSDLLAAGGLGVPNVLLMTGDRPERGDHPDAPGVFDLDSDSLTAAARALRDDGTLLSGQAVDPAPRYLIGAVDPGAGEPERLARKVALGAEFVQTQFVFDVAAFAGWLAAGARPRPHPAVRRPRGRRADPFPAGAGRDGRAARGGGAPPLWNDGCAVCPRTGWPRRGWRLRRDRRRAAGAARPRGRARDGGGLRARRARDPHRRRAGPRSIRGSGADPPGSAPLPLSRRARPLPSCGPAGPTVGAGSPAAGAPRPPPPRPRSATAGRT